MNFYNIAITILTVVFGFLFGYFRTKTKLIEEIKFKIVQAEKIYEGYTKAGKEKFNWVVDNLFKLVPQPLTTIFTKEIIGMLVQSAFETMADYATTQLDKIVDKGEQGDTHD